MITFWVITDDHVNMPGGIRPITRRMRFDAENMAEALGMAAFHCRHYYDIYVHRVFFESFGAGKRIKILVDGMDPMTGDELVGVHIGYIKEEECRCWHRTIGSSNARYAARSPWWNAPRSPSPGNGFRLPTAHAMASILTA